jgi:hypothetical protein
MSSIIRGLGAASAALATLLTMNVAKADSFEFNATQREDGLRVLAFGVLVGAASGGDQTVLATYTDGSQSSFKAGQGAFVGGGVRWTPLWYQQLVGLGLALDVGWKGTGIYATNANIYFTRVPVTLTARGSLALAETFSFFAGAGGTLELAPHLQGDGQASSLDVRFDTPLGGVVEVGLMWEAMQHIGIELLGDVRFLRYHSTAGSLDGKSLGFLLGLHGLL